MIGGHVLFVVLGATMIGAIVGNLMFIISPILGLPSWILAFLIAMYFGLFAGKERRK